MCNHLPLTTYLLPLTSYLFYKCWFFTATICAIMLSAISGAVLDLIGKPTPGQHGNAHINSMQFRAGKELEMPKPANTYRIFITGGSTAYGSGAPACP